MKIDRDVTMEMQLARARDAADYHSCELRRDQVGEGARRQRQKHEEKVTETEINPELVTEPEIETDPDTELEIETKEEPETEL